MTLNFHPFWERQIANNNNNIYYYYYYYCKVTIRNEPNSVGFAREKTQTMSFVERGFERLGLGHQAVGFSWCSYMVKLSSPLESFSWRWAGRFWFFGHFSQPFL